MEENQEVNKTAQKAGTIIAIAAFAVIVLIIVLAIVFGRKDDSNNGNQTNNATNSSIIPSEYQGSVNAYEKEHEITYFKLKYVAPADMLILTDDEINLYMGQGYSELYDFVAVDQSVKKMLYCFIIDNASDLSAEDYIKQSLKDVDYGEIRKETIAGREFSAVTIPRKEDDTNLLEECYVYTEHNRFLCLDYWHDVAAPNNVAEVIQEVQQ